MSRFGRRWGPFLGGLIAAVALIAAILLAYTRTELGREKILAITLSTLGGQVNGTLEMGQLEGGLFTGARIYELALTDPQGRPMVTADSAYIEYRLATFFGGDMVINRLVLHGAEMLIYRMPGDSLWNYQQVLQDTTPEVPGTRGRATIVHELRVVDATVTVRLPWEPAEDVTGQERDREIEAALSDTSRLAVESVPGGYLRTIVVRAQDASVEALTVGPDERGGTYLRVVEALAEVDLYRDRPLRLQGMEGELSLREGVMRYSAPRVQLPGSSLASEGVVDLSGEEPLYDIQVSGTDVALEDVRWLYPAFPEDGVATFGLEVETRPDQIFLRATNLSVSAPGTRLAGEFTMLMGDTLLFSDVSLRADPLDMNTVEGMLPVAIPVRGLQIGALEIESPAS
jgi:hypothetical protein